MGGRMIFEDAVSRRIDAVIRFLLYVLALMLPYSKSTIETVVVLGAVLWLVKRVRIFCLETRQSGKLAAWSSFRPFPSALDPAVGFFLLVCLFSSLGSAFTAIAMKGLFSKTLEWFVIYYLVLETFTEQRHFKVLAVILTVTCALTCIDAIIQYFWTGVDLFRGQKMERGGATGGFDHPNKLGSYLTVMIPLLLSGLLSRGLRKARPLVFFALLLAVTAMFLTFSRASWFSLTMGLTAMMLILRKYRYVGMIVLLIVILLVGARVMPGQVKQSIRLDHHSLSGTMAWRKGLWSDSLEMIKDRPFYGHGLNIYMRLFQAYRRKYEGLYDFGPTYAHNCYLQMAAETGILGLLGFLTILGRFLAEIRRGLRNAVLRQDSFYRSLFLGMGSGIVAFLCHSFFEVNFYSLQLSALFWFVAGIAIAANRSLSANQEQYM